MLTGSKNLDSVTELPGTFSGMSHGHKGGGAFAIGNASYRMTCPSAGSVTNHAGTFSRMVKISDIKKAAGRAYSRCLL